MMLQSVPRATYRLQLSRDFDFAAAEKLAPYLAELGISHLYVSPILKARRGSSHGYDVVDHTTFNPELGSVWDFEQLCATYRRHGIGIILDIVPNHMGIGGDQNELWLDVLRWGRSSRYADWFDIDWSPEEQTLQGRVLVPFLATPFGEALQSGRLQLRYDASSRSYDVWAEDTHRLPVNPTCFELIGDPDRVAHFNSAGGRDDLAQLIERQHWRPARYSVAADDINYRRFFIVSDLAGIRVEREEVFEHTHAVVADLVAEGLVQGLRVDHIDGLHDPKAYCLRLRERCPKLEYLVVEKILAGHEKLRDDWGVDGTTGYEFAAVATRLLTDGRAEAKLSELYRSYTGRAEILEQVERDAKRGIIDFEMTAELDRIASALRRLAAAAPETADLTRNALRSALREVVASMPVYRTYLDSGAIDERDVRNIEAAIAAARRSAPMLHPSVFDFLGQVMTGALEQGRAVASRIQQFTGPVMAKGLEDTSLYRYNRLIALSDVGEKPDRFTTSVEAFHDWARSRAADAAKGLLTSSSHDSKRGEDARARIAALSGYADRWAAAIEEWDALLHASNAPVIEANDRYYFYQLLLGAWPARLSVEHHPDALAAFRERLDAAMLKSVREARLKTNWSVPRTAYEEDVSAFVATALADREFRTALLEFERLVGPAGAQNGLVQTALKLTVPGVPDIYRGAEGWEQSMVDPDNRRPVDFDQLADGLASARRASLMELKRHWRDGRIKQRVIADLLALRVKKPEVFATGAYRPVAASETNICAFERCLGNSRIVVAVRLGPWVAEAWGPDLPIDLDRGVEWHAVLGDPGFNAFEHGLFAQLPVAVLVNEPI